MTGSPATARAYDRATWLLLALVALAIALTFQDYGISWDEPVQNTYGKLTLAYYRTLGQDKSSFSYINLFWYGAMFDLLAATANLVSPFAEFDTRHLLGALFGLIGLAGTWRLGRQLGGPRTGFIAALLLAATPVWYGNSFINPKDIPFAAAMTWAALYTIRIAQGLAAEPEPRWRWSDFAWLGVAVGAAMGTRVGGLIALLYLGAVYALFACLGLLDRRGLGRLARDAAGLAIPTALSVVLALSIMYLFWPWAQQRPIAAPIEAFESFSRFPITLEFPFWGHVIVSTAVPWYYEPGMMGAMLPELTLGGGVLALVLALAGLFRRGRSWRAMLPYLALALAILFPPAYVAAERAVLFDGMRHLLFVVPPLTVAAALAVDAIWRRGMAGSVISMVLLGVTAMYQASVLLRAHPYQYLAFNTLAGGVAGAAGKFELDYWGTAFREAVATMAEKLPPPAEGRPWRVSVCGPETSAQIFFPPGFVLLPRQRIVDADLLITNTRYQCPRGTSLATAPILSVISRFETPLAYVYDLRAHRSLTYSPHPPSP